MTTPSPAYRAGYLNAEWWPIGIGVDGSAHVPDKRVFVPKFVLPFHYGKTMYHYTTVHGLFGIVRAGAVWASHVRYMNDVAEVAHGRQVAIETLGRLASKARFGEFRRILRLAAERIMHTDAPNYFVASFSMLDDDLTQWRAYGRDRGITIGFDLSTPDGQRHFHLPVVTIYRDHEKTGLIIFRVRKYFDEFIKDLEFYNNKLPDWTWDARARSLAKKLQFEFIRFKHRSFASEREIRLVISDRQRDRSRPDGHRVRGSFIVPYYKTTEIWRRDGVEIEPPKLPISSVTVGPMPDKNLCASSVRDFLEFHGYDPALVRVSELPYRAS